MVNPRSLVYTLHKHGEVIEHLVRLTRDTPAFDRDQVLAVVRRHDPETDADALLQSLVTADVLQMQARSGSIQVSDATLLRLDNNLVHAGLRPATVLPGAVAPLPEAIIGRSHNIARARDSQAGTRVHERGYLLVKAIAPDAAWHSARQGRLDVAAWCRVAGTAAVAIPAGSVDWATTEWTKRSGPVREAPRAIVGALRCAHFHHPKNWLITPRTGLSPQELAYRTKDWSWFLIWAASHWPPA